MTTKIINMKENNKRFYLNILWSVNILTVLIFISGIFILGLFWGTNFKTVYFDFMVNSLYILGPLTFLFWILNLRIAWYKRVGFHHFILLIMFSSFYAPIFYWKMKKK